MFEENPCRRNVFDVFAVDRSQTDIRKVNDAIARSRKVWEHQKQRVKARDGTEFELDEARLNAMQKLLLDPVERLKQEQFVHQIHLFTDDEELMALAGKMETPLDEANTLQGLQTSLLGIFGHLVPAMEPQPMVDSDMPWPEAPAPFEVERESLDDAILREQ